MSRMKLLVGTVLALGVGLGMSAPASATPCSAGTCTYTGSTGLLLLPQFAPAAGTYSQFDPSLGTLTGISLSVTAGLSTSGTVQNTGAAAASFQYSVTAVVSSIGTDPLSTTIFTGNAGQGFTVTTAAAQQTFINLAAGASAPFGTGAGNLNPYTETGSATLAVSSANFSPFIATGTPNIYSMDVSMLGSFTALGAANVNSSLTTDGSESWTLTYTYTPAPVPEPATMALLVTGLIGLGTARWRKRS